LSRSFVHRPAAPDVFSSAPMTSLTGADSNESNESN
jgi:hypothetical protein